MIAEGLTALDWVQASAVLAAGLGAGRVLRRLLARRVHCDESEPGAAVVVGRIGGMTVALTGLVYALGILGVRLGPLLGAIGIGGIAVALAAQSLLANFFASVILQVRRPFRRGDQIASGELEGRVEDVNFRTVVLRSYDGERLLLPCAKVLESPIVNHSALGRRRTCLPVTLDYDTDLGVALHVLRGAVAEVDGVLAQPAPEVLVDRLGEAGVGVAVLYWHVPDDSLSRQVRSAVAMAMKASLEEAAIEIAFQERVIECRIQRAS
ncbi:MAG: mechanosensitive ion channel family protein [Acidimicrobiia bacterium]